MSSDSTSEYTYPSGGSISGFNQVDLPINGPNLPQAGWSVSQIKAFLLNEYGETFPSKALVAKIYALITSHINDFNNPHQVTLDQITKKFVDDVLGNVIPGTPPDIPPFFSYDSVGHLPLGDIFPATYTNTNLYRVTEGNRFVDPSTELEVTGTDYLNEQPGIPLFSQLINSLATDWYSNPSYCLNTTLAKVDHPTLNYPFDFYTVSETNTYGSFGISIPVNIVDAEVRTLTLFLLPFTSTGSVIISQKDDNSVNLLIDLRDGSYAVSSTNVLGEVIMYPSGLMKVSYSFTPKYPNSNTGINIIHRNTDNVQTERQGSGGRPLFCMAAPYVTTSTINQPILIDSTRPASTTPMVLGLDKAQAPANLSNFMVTLTLNLYPALPTAEVDTHILQFDGLLITRDETSIYVILNGNKLFTSVILPGLNIISLSYSPTTLIFKDLAQSRQSVVGEYSSLSTANVVLGPCSGYVQNLAFYGMSDTTQCVEYLTNG